MIRLLLLTIVLATAGMATPNVNSDTLQRLSETTFRSDDYEYEYSTSTLGQQNIWVVVGLRVRGQLGGPQRFQMWKLDLAGKKLAQIDFDAITPTGNSQEKYLRIYDLATLKNGNIGLLAGTQNGKIGFLVFDGDSAQLVTNRLVELPYANTFISKVFTADDGDLIALGRSGTQPMILKLRPSGEQASLKLLANDDLTVLTDGLELADHTFAFLGERLDDAGKINLWLGRVTLKGEVLNKTSFAGQEGTIVYDNTARNYIVTYVSPGTAAWNVSLRTFTDDLTPAGQFGLQSGLKQSMRLCAVPVGDGTIFVVGATAKNQLWTAQVDKTGKIISSSIFEEPNARWQRLWNYDLLSTSAELVIPFTELLVGNEMEQRQVMKILRLRRQ